MSPTMMIGMSARTIGSSPSVSGMDHFPSGKWTPPVGERGEGSRAAEWREIGARAQRGIAISQNVPLTPRGTGPLVSGAERPSAAAVASRTACRPEGACARGGRRLRSRQRGRPPRCRQRGATAHSERQVIVDLCSGPVHAQASPYSCGRERRRPYGRGWVAGQARAEPSRAAALGNRRPRAGGARGGGRRGAEQAGLCLGARRNHQVRRASAVTAAWRATARTTSMADWEPRGAARLRSTANAAALG